MRASGGRASAGEISSKSKVSGFQGFRVSRFQGFKVSGFQGFRVSRFQRFQG
jgi:hypothetical protein